MPNISRRTILASTAGLAAVGLSPASLARASAAGPSALLLEHRRLADRVRAFDALEDEWLSDLTTILKTIKSDDDREPDRLIDVEMTKRTAIREQMLLPMVPVARRIWQTPVRTFEDIAARAELAAFWGWGDHAKWGYTEHHGYHDRFHEGILVDAIVAISKTGSHIEIAYVPSDLILKRRRIEQEWCRSYPLCKNKAEQDALRDQHFEDSFEVESKLLGTIIPARSWSDIAVRAELTMWHRRNMLSTWASIDADDTPRLLDHRSFAELLAAILALADIPRPPRHEDSLLDRLPVLPEPDVDDDEV